MIFRKNKKHTFNDKIYNGEITGEIKAVLRKIEYILANNGHFDQANFITRLQDNIENEEYDELYNNYDSSY